MTRNQLLRFAEAIASVSAIERLTPYRDEPSPARLLVRWVESLAVSGADFRRPLPTPALGDEAYVLMSRPDLADAIRVLRTFYGRGFAEMESHPCCPKGFLPPWAFAELAAPRPDP